VLSARREQARALAEAIDRALRHRGPADLQRVMDAARRQEPARVADRVQLQAKRLAKTQAARRARILQLADELVQRLYLGAAPPGWLCGWCDAAVLRDVADRCAAVGGVLLDDRGRELARLSEPVAERQAFEAEIAAAQAILQSAAKRGAHTQRIRVHTDCGALVSLWLRRRRDPRLAALRALAARLRRFELRRVPRRHNRIADRLAREALRGDAV